MSFRPEARHLTRKLKKDLSEKMQMAKSRDFNVRCQAGDPEALTFAVEIKNFIKEKGYQCSGVLSDTGITGGKGLPTLFFYPDGTEILIGPNIKTGHPMVSSRGGILTNMGDI